ncbi:hypothetical protein F511_39472 [Dorcoceras hygrometricum]|uniref:Uncharacterized protein n=1 Tax=Dorcoceras hygrometricum TaxID=472368 RepID=A0A2Z7D0A5_9LAMI|nr:hypothetical protein F511_39472 [Dorcoceras hygrometricum]
MKTLLARTQCRFAFVCTVHISLASLDLLCLTRSGLIFLHYSSELILRSKLLLCLSALFCSCACLLYSALRYFLYLGSGLIFFD